MTPVNFRKSIDELIRIQESLVQQGRDPQAEMGASMEQLRAIQEQTTRLGSNAWAGRAQILVQILGLYGLGKLTSFIDSRRDIDREIRVGLDYLKNIYTWQELDAFRGIPNIPVDFFNLNMARHDQHGMNTMNRWAVAFGKNKTLSQGDNILLSTLTKTCELDAHNISTEKMDIISTEGEDISDIKIPTSVSVSFLVDREMNIRKAFDKVMNAQRNRRTGRYGYKDNYKWEQLVLYIYDGSNRTQRVYVMKDLIMTNLGGISLTYEPSALQVMPVTFSFSELDYRL